VLLGISDAGLAAVLAEAAFAEGVRTVHVSNGADTIQSAKSSPPSLIIVEDNPPDMDGLSVCRSLRMDGDHRLTDVPIVIVGKQEKEREAMSAGVTGWLTTPFSAQYAKAQIQAWLMRSACRWLRAPLPQDEDMRLTALRELSILDTPPEERFDRITRVAAALADVPIALVTLVDEHRQWFKSCVGLDVSETSREVAFCAHVALSRKPMIVPDTHLDERFADSPLVTGGPRIRFYAGFPLFHQKGGCLGTLCLIDTRPRQFSETAIQRFADLANVVQQELNSSPRQAASS
jgi:CheY-like chemotaxis protein